MAISFINAVEVTYAQTTNITVGKPTNTADNDIILVSIGMWANVAVTAPAGWNLYNAWTANGLYQKVYWKKAASEGASWTWTWTGDQECDASALTYRGADYKAATPFDCAATTNSSASGTSLVLSQVTTVTPAAMIVAMGLSSSEGPKSCAAFTNERVDSSDDEFAYDEGQASAGASGSYTITVPSGMSSGILLALRELVPQVYYSVSPFGTGDIKTAAVPSYVNGVFYDPDSAGETSVAATLNGVTAGNLIVVFVSWGANDRTPTVSDGTSSLTAGTKVTSSGGGFYNYNQVFYLLAANSGNRTYTVTFGGAVAYPSISVEEFSASGAWTFDTQNTGNGNSSSLLSGNITTATANEVILSGLSLYGSTTYSDRLINEAAVTTPALGQTNNELSYRIVNAIVTNGHTQATSVSGANYWGCNIISFYAIPTISITSGVATITTAQTGNIGQGCSIVYGGHTCYISKVNSSTSFDVVDAVGVAAADHASVAVTSIGHVFATLIDAEAGADELAGLDVNDSLVNADIVLNLCCYYDHADYTADIFEWALEVNGYTVDSTRYMKIYTPTGGTQSINNQRHSGVWSSSKYAISCTGDGIDISDDYVIVEGMQVAITYSDGYDIGVNVAQAEGARVGIVIRSNIIKMLNPGVDHSACKCINVGDANGMSVKIYNNICYNEGTLGRCIGICGENGTASSIVVYNNLCTRFNKGIYDQAGHLITIKNCVSFNNVTDLDDDNYTLISYCASDDAVGASHVHLNSNAGGEWTAAFTDYANYDFHVKDTSSLLYNAGTDLSAVMDSVDIIGTSRQTSVTQTLAGSPDDTDMFGTSTRVYTSGGYVAVGNKTVTKVEVILGIDAGTPLQGGRTITCYIYAASGVAPTGAAIATSTNTVSGTIVEDTTYTFNFAGWSQISGTRYCVVLGVSSSDATNQPNWHGLDGGAEANYYSSNGSSWTLNQSSIQMSIAVTGISWDIGAFEYAEGGTISLVQEGFRFRNDDGSETTATWKAAEDTGITLPSGNTVRLRLVIDATGASNAIPQLEYRLQPAGNNNWGNWTKVT